MIPAILRKLFDLFMDSVCVWFGRFPVYFDRLHGIFYRIALTNEDARHYLRAEMVA